MRFRWSRQLKQFWIFNFLTLRVVQRSIKVCQRSSWRLVALFSLCVLMLWCFKGGDDILCDGEDMQQLICQEFSMHGVSGNICYDLCVSKVYQFSGCSNLARDGVIKTFQVLRDGSFLPHTTAVVSWSAPELKQGLTIGNYTVLLESVLAQRLERTLELEVLTRRLMDDFDFNRDGKLNYGEAQTLWSLVHQPKFFNNYLFQSTGAVPHLNGTCGPLSIWSHCATCPHLFSTRSLWPLSLLYPKAYRMTLPSWPRRAKIMVSLLEFVEDLVETHGARFHLCNISSETLSYDKNNEIVINVENQLLSAQQIKMALVNHTCHHDHDCVFSIQCQSKCHIPTRTCTSQLVRPTIAHICDILYDYLIYDAPKQLRRKLARQVHQCRHLWRSAFNFHVLHSIIIVDIKATLWGYIQDIKL